MRLMHNNLYLLINEVTHRIYILPSYIITPTKILRLISVKPMRFQVVRIILWYLW